MVSPLVERSNSALMCARGRPISGGGMADASRPQGLAPGADSALAMADSAPSRLSVSIEGIEHGGPAAPKSFHRGQKLVLHVHRLLRYDNSRTAVARFKRQREIEVSEQNAVVAVYETHAGAEEAVKELQRAGIDLHTLSIVGKDTDRKSTRLNSSH